MSQIHLPVGTPLAYLREVVWDDTFAQDRFYAYADKALIDQVKQAAAEGNSRRSTDLFSFTKGQR
jgi:hypothetical protein